MTVTNGISQETSIEAGTRVANGVGICVIKASRRSRCPLMPPLKVHHYRDEPIGRTKITRQHDIISISQGTACM